MKNYVLVLCLLISISSYAQVTFEKSISDGYSDWGTSIRQCNDKGYIILGSSAMGTSSLYLIKTDSLGNTMWSKYFYSCSYANAIEKTFDGGYILLGYENSDISVFKIDSSGNVNWSKKILNYEGNNIVQTSDSGYVIAGTYEVASGNEDIFMIKLDSKGDSLWYKTYGDSGFDVVNDLKTTNDNGYIIAGTSQLGYHGNYELDIIKLDFAGNIVWANKYNEGTDAYSIDKTFDNGYIILGYEYGMLLMKIDSIGNVKWTKTLGGSQGSCIIETEDKGFFAITDYSHVAKIDSAGNIIWEKHFNLIDGISPNCIQTNDKGFAIIGRHEDDLTQKNDIILIKMDSNGCVRPSIHQISGPLHVTVNEPSEFNVNLNYGTDSIIYNWSVKHGQIVSGQGSLSVNISWDKTGTDTISIVASNDCGKDSSSYIVNILDCVIPLITPITADNYVDSWPTHTNCKIDLLEGSKPVNILWIAPQGDINYGQNTDSAIVSWSQVGIIDSILVIASNQCGSDSSAYNTIIYICICNVKEENNANSNNILIYPNPASDRIFIEHVLKQNAEISIYNLVGDIVLQKQLNNEECEIDISGLSKGIYLIRLINSLETIQQKLIKE